MMKRPVIESDKVTTLYGGLRLKKYHQTPTNDGRVTSDVVLNQFGNVMIWSRKDKDWVSTGLCGYANH